MNQEEIPDDADNNMFLELANETRFEGRYKAMKVEDLKAMCKELKIKGYSNKTRNQLIQMLVDNRTQEGRHAD